MEESILKTIYRGRRFITREWVYGHLLTRKNKCYIVTADAADFMVISNGTASMKLIEVDPETVGAYTLHNDRNDIKVFTGDVLETITDARSIYTNEFRALVLYDQYTSMYYANGFCYVQPYEFRFCRIIGNIYDNPELLDSVDLTDGEDEEDSELDEIDEFIAGCEDFLKDNEK